MDINTKILDILGRKMDKSVTKNIYSCLYCEYCDSEWSNKFNYTRHIGTEKHRKNWTKSKELLQKEQEIGHLLQKNEYLLQKTRENQTEAKSEEHISHGVGKSSGKQIETRYCCDYCQFSTTCKKNAKKHRNSKEHIKNENKEEDFLEITNKYICLSCDKAYDKYKSCWEHLKRCKGKENSEPEPETAANVVFEIVEQPPSEMASTGLDLEAIKKEVYKEIYESVVGKILENNNQIVEKILESNQQTAVKIVETMSQSQQALVQTSNSNNNITNNHTINNNQHCTINMFLNEKCKDAVNITDWVNNLVINFEHLYYNAENGFQKGLTKMLIDNLKLYNVYKRPIHFTDVKRDTMYIKDDDAWTKHDNHDKLIEVLETGARQGITCFAEWMEENAPGYHDLDSPLGQQYMAIHQNVIRPQTDRMKAYPKVMKEVARAVQLRKGDQDQA